MTNNKKNLEVSPRFSLKGWKIGEWLKGNREAIKLFITAAVGLIPPVSVPWRLFLAAITKLLLDTIDFWANEVEL